MCPLNYSFLNYLWRIIGLSKFCFFVFFGGGGGGWRAGFNSQSTKSEKKRFLSVFFPDGFWINSSPHLSRVKGVLETRIQCPWSGCVHRYREDKWRTKLSRLLIDGRTTVLRSVFDGFHLLAKRGSWPQCQPSHLNEQSVQEKKLIGQEI